MVFDWAFLTFLYKRARTEDFFLLQKLGKNVRLSETIDVRIRIEKGGMSLATLGKIGDPPYAVRKSPGLSDMVVSPAQIFEYDTITERDVYTPAKPEIIAIEGMSDVVSNAEYIRALKIQELKNRVNRRLEHMFAELISTGGISYNDGLRSYSLSFEITPSSYSYDPEAGGMYSKLLEYCDDMRATGHNPDMIIVTPSVAKLILSDKEVASLASNSGFGVGNVLLKTYTTARDLIALPGLPVITVYMAKYTNEAGTSYNDYISGDLIMIVDSTAFALAFGAVVNYKLGDEPKMGQVFVWEDVINEGTEKAIFVLSRPLPYLLSTDALKIVQVSTV